VIGAYETIQPCGNKQAILRTICVRPAYSSWSMPSFMHVVKPQCRHVESRSVTSIPSKSADGPPRNGSQQHHPLRATDSPASNDPVRSTAPICTVFLLELETVWAVIGWQA
jgi:hypothetical protein